MTRILLSFSMIISLMIFSFSGPEQKTTGLKPGEKAIPFQLKSTSDQIISLDNFKNEKGIILIFTCNHCPFSIAYEDRIIALHQEYAPKGFPVVAINPNDALSYPDDSFENMKIRAGEKKFPFSYLHDESQEIAAKYGANKTPHVFLLQKKGSEFEVVYIGAIDDNTDNPEAVTKPYVKNAIEQLLKGNKPEVNITKAIGCSIKWKKS